VERGSGAALAEVRIEESIRVATVTPLPIGGRPRSTQGAGRRPPLRLILRTGDPAVDGPLGVASVEARVTGGRTPVRLALTVNGELVRTWAASRGRFDLVLDEYGPGRHVVTARATDGVGRRAVASVVVVAVAVEAAGADEEETDAGLTAGPSRA
jgi:hypothetical protein